MNSAINKRIHFYKAGNGAPLVLIGGEKKDWGEALEILSDYFTVIVPSFSQPIISQQENSDIVNYIEIIRNELGLSNFSILAHSLGVFTALLYAKNHPENLRSLVLSNIPDLEKGNALKFDKIFNTLILKKNSSKAVERDFWYENVEKQLQLLDFNNINNNTNVIKTLLLTGEKDSLSSVDLHNHWRSYLNSQYDLKIFKHSGHFPMKDNPLYFSLVIKNFVSQ